MGNLVKYASFDLAEAEEQEKELSRGSSNYLEVQQGLNIFRFIPALVGHPNFVITHNHFIEVPGTDDKVSFNCPRLMVAKGQPRGKCPACEAADRLAASGNPLDRKRAEKFWPRKRVYGNALNRAQPEAGVQVFAFGKKIHERLLYFRKTDEIDFMDPINGYDIKIMRKGTGMATKYPSIDLARKPSKLAATAAEVNALIEGAPQLDRYGVVPSEDELDAHMEKAGAVMEDLDDAPRARKPQARTAADDADATDADFDDVKEDDL